MHFTSIHQAIEHVEAQLDAVSAALLSGDAAGLQGHCEVLRETSIEFSQYLGSAGRQEWARSPAKSKLLAIAQRLSVQRENLARRKFVVDRQVACLVPASQQSPTYGAPATGMPGRSAAVARIYVNRAT